MAFQISKKKQLVSDINVTPFVDVVLVLLIIFMITAPLMFSNTKLQLPKTKKVEKLSLTSKQVILSIDSDGDIYIGKQKYLMEEIIPTIKKHFAEYKTETVYLRAHYGLDYGRVARMVTLLKVNGIHQISLITEIEKESK